jgi:molecular chaperone GrpE (heat shock protein)
MPFPRLTSARCKRSWPFRGTAAWRLLADFDNFRKRAVRETERSAAAQKEAFIRELLPVIDNLERALAARLSPRQRSL